MKKFRRKLVKSLTVIICLVDESHLCYSFAHRFLIHNVGEVLAGLVNSSFPNNLVSWDLAVGPMVAVVHGSIG